jgi:hypothetical protein
MELHSEAYDPFDPLNWRKFSVNHITFL